MSLDEYQQKTFELCSDLDRLSMIANRVTRTLFSSVTIKERVLRIVPLNIETVADSAMVQLVTFCASLRKESLAPSEDKIDRDHIVDCEWQPAASYFQGVIRGISGLNQGQPWLQPQSKTPFSEGVWYVQSRVLLNMKMNNLALLIPKQTGLFSYSSTKGKGLTMAENIALVSIVNSCIDRLQATPELIKYCLISPTVLKSRQILKHKTPSSKKMMYWPSEVTHFLKTTNVELAALTQPLEAVYKTVQDKASYEQYIEAIKLYNKRFAEITAVPDRIASYRYSVLFKKGMKGDQDTRLGSLDLDELCKLCPSDWKGGTKPLLVTKTDQGVLDFINQIDWLINASKNTFVGGALTEWKAYVVRLPAVERVLRTESKSKGSGGDRPPGSSNSPSILDEENDDLIKSDF